VYNAHIQQLIACGCTVTILVSFYLYSCLLIPPRSYVITHIFCGLKLNICPFHSISSNFWARSVKIKKAPECEGVAVSWFSPENPFMFNDDHALTGCVCQLCLFDVSSIIIVQTYSSCLSHFRLAFTNFVDYLYIFDKFLSPFDWCWCAHELLPQ